MTLSLKSIQADILRCRGNITSPAEDGILDILQELLGWMREAEAKPSHHECPRCHQSVNGEHECYNSVLNEGGVESTPTPKIDGREELAESEQNKATSSSSGDVFPTPPLNNERPSIICPCACHEGFGRTCPGCDCVHVLSLPKENEAEMVKMHERLVIMESALREKEQELATARLAYGKLFNENAALEGRYWEANDTLSAKTELLAETEERLAAQSAELERLRGALDEITNKVAAMYTTDSVKRLKALATIIQGVVRAALAPSEGEKP